MEKEIEQAAEELRSVLKDVFPFDPDDLPILVRSALRVAKEFVRSVPSQEITDFLKGDLGPALAPFGEMFKQLRTDSVKEKGDQVAHLKQMGIDDSIAWQIVESVHKSSAEAFAKGVESVQKARGQ